MCVSVIVGVGVLGAKFEWVTFQYCCFELPLCCYPRCIIADVIRLVLLSGRLLYQCLVYTVYVWSSFTTTLCVLLEC